MSDHVISRRDFCRLAALAGVLGAAGAGAAGCATVPTYRTTIDRGRLFVPREQLYRTDGVEILMVTAPGASEPALLIRRGENFSAVSAVCPHQGCHVRPSRSLLVCPCHQSTFDLDGNLLRGPAQRPLTPLPVAVTATGVEIRLGDAYRSENPR